MIIITAIIGGLLFFLSNIDNKNYYHLCFYLGVMMECTLNTRAVPKGMNARVGRLKRSFTGGLQVALLLSPLYASLSYAQSSSAVQLDKVVVSASQREQDAIDALDNVVGLDKKDIDRLEASSATQLLNQIPGVNASATGDDPGAVVNVRGLQEYGRVVVTIDGVRQDFGRPSHAGNGSFYIDPDMLKAVTVIRGPVAGIYGSGGIGGSISFETIDARDFLDKDEKWAIGLKGGYESNGDALLGHTTAAFRITDKADILVSTSNRHSDDSKDGSGNKILYSGQRSDSQLVKGSFRPQEGHELKWGWLRYNADYDSSRSAGSRSPTLSVDDTNTNTYTGNVRYSFKSPTNPFINLQVEAYRSVTETDQTRLSDAENRLYRVRTNGWSLKNQSLLSSSQWDHIFSYGVDGYHLEGTSTHNNFGEGQTKSWGGYAQWESNYNDWLQMIGALRYDHYSLEGADRDQVTRKKSKSRVSPRLTLGITPVEDITTYITYAEGYRAPSIAEVFRGGGHGSLTTHIPNFDLEPETASTIELGINHKKDALFTADDALRTKFSVYHTHVKDYIDREYLTINKRRYTQFQNKGKVRLRGVELDSRYDNGNYYGHVNGSFTSISSYDGRPLNNAPLKRIALTLGARSLDKQWDYGARWTLTGSTERTSETAPRSASYQLVDLYSSWKPNKAVTVSFGVDNLFNKTYTDPQAGYVANNPSSWQGRGRSVKVNVGWRYGS